YGLSTQATSTQAPTSTATKREPPWAEATSSSTLLRPPFCASATPDCTSAGVCTVLLPIFCTTSPGCRPLSAASLLGSTLVITTPLAASLRLKVLRASGVSAASPKPMALPVASGPGGGLGMLDATLSSGRLPISAFQVFD